MNGRPPPRQAQYVAFVDQLAQQIGGDRAQVLRVGRVLGGVGGRLHDDGVPEPVPGPERVRPLGIELGRYPDLDPYEVTLEGGLQDPGHLEAAHAELLGNLDLGLALQVEAARHGRRLHQLRGSHPQG